MLMPRPSPVVMLAAISNSHKPSSNSLVKKCLNKLRLSLLSKPPNLPFSPQQTLLYPILSLLPVLVKSRCAGIASVGAEIVGAASLLSFEMNDLIASDCEIVRALVSALASSKRRISSAACNAVLDLSTTSVGRQRLLEFSAVENLMFGFLQVTKSSTTFVSLCNVDKGSDICLRIVFEEDDLPALILDAVLILINTCNSEQLEKIPRRLSQTFLVYLKELWAKVRSQMLPGHTLKFIRERHFYSTNVGINNLAESIFRLSIIAGQLTTPFPYEVIKRNIFGLNESSFENFILNHWEISPFLISKHSNVLNEQDNMFSSFVQLLNSKGTVISILSFILKSLVSCPPIASDELDILGFLKKVENKLGCSIVYQQDVRVVRTEKCLKREVHFLPDISDSYIKAPYVFNIDDILKCEEAYKEGYTIALRGMEFRFESISAIADGLASLFGQPSVGANLYLTPPNSQGLACHCDDHCVFVCQLLGSKQWKIFAQPIVRLPRLYEPLDSLHGSEVESPMAECRQLLLREGDVLYIPRGFPHEACTVADDGEPNGSTGFSLHLTFGIEVEPLFEWEGFAHVALNCW
ncbi:hypothetical protein L1049_001565 [Liquidambar formosana]|uniref:Bifunctional lysine-specific demethylase and histidyl-hydroxylase n=1 Tax=Liquidambar formosana TaxID=63359 RepID=A0AAP0R4J2_LIQFO